MRGLTKLTEKEKEVFRKLVEYHCQECDKHEDACGKLQPHRIIRGIEGGTYAPNNVLMNCDGCHKLKHQGEDK